jgi:glycosyltransferase involved in cell wall biosynthesis
MAAAFATLGIETTLVGLGNHGSTPQGVRVTYGVPDTFDIRLVRYDGLLGHRIRYALKIFAGRWLSADAVIYTRVPKIAALAALLRRPCVLELHHPPARSNKGHLDRHMRASTGGRLVVITETLKDWAIKELCIPPYKVLVAHDGADPFPEGVQPALRPTGRCRVGYLGHLYPGKGMEVIAELAPRLPEIDFLVVGGTLEDLRFWQTSTRGIDNLRFVGPVPHAETPAWLCAFDIALLPNQRAVGVSGGGGDIGRWTSPLKAFEYMSAGLPVIASDLENLREIFTDGETALLCPPDALDDWEAAVRRLVGNASLRQHLKKQARQIFLDRYSWVQRAEAIAQWAKMK